MTPTRLNRRAYEQLIEEDIAWLLTMPRTLEREHIVAVLRASPEHEYADSAAPAPAPSTTPSPDPTRILLERAASLLRRFAIDGEGRMPRLSQDEEECAAMDARRLVSEIRTHLATPADRPALAAERSAARSRARGRWALVRGSRPPVHGGGTAGSRRVRAATVLSRAMGAAILVAKQFATSRVRAFDVGSP